MTILTHAMSGLIFGAPLLATRPMTAAAFIFGCVLPDLDTFARMSGKVSFLKFHQTLLHSFATTFAVALLFLPVPGLLGLQDNWISIGLAGGMLLHSLGDLSNTYGVAIFAPISWRRYCLNWVFFIDAPTFLAATAATIGTLLPMWQGLEIPLWPSVFFASFVAVYWTAKWRLLRAVCRKCPADTKSVLPDALFPWRFHGHVLQDQDARLFGVNAITGRLSGEVTRHVLDEQYRQVLETLPEYRIMRELSAGYHATEATQIGDRLQITCRDLRTRHFGGRFGMLKVTLDSAGHVVGKEFHV